jgi:hypothetical protein
VSTANSVLGVFDIFFEGRSIVSLDDVHTHSINLFDGLPHLPILFVVVSILKTLTPMAEVAWYYKQTIGLLEVWQQDSSVVLLHF